MNVGGNHWFFCREHKVRWCAGYNLFSSWKDEDEAIWQENIKLLLPFREVQPLPPDDLGVA